MGNFKYYSFEFPKNEITMAVNLIYWKSIKYPYNHASKTNEM